MVKIDKDEMDRADMVRFWLLGLLAGKDPGQWRVTKFVDEQSWEFQMTRKMILAFSGTDFGRQIVSEMEPYDYPYHFGITRKSMREIELPQLFGILRRAVDSAEASYRMAQEAARDRIQSGRLPRG